MSIVRPLAPLLLLALIAGPSVAGDATDLPGIGTVAPAFALYSFASAAEDAPEPVQLDEQCGLRPGDTKGLLLTFVDATGVADLQVANGWSRKHERNGLAVIAISIESSPAAFRGVVDKEGLRFPVLDDRHGIVARRYGIPTVPFTFVLNAECRVVGFVDKPLKDMGDQLEPAIKAVLESQLSSTRRFDEE